MKVNIIGNGSIGAKYMSASTLLDDHVLVDVPNGVTKHLKNLGYDVLAIDTILLTAIITSAKTKQINPIFQFIISNTPRDVAIPFPPLNSKKIGKV